MKSPCCSVAGAERRSSVSRASGTDASPLPRHPPWWLPPSKACGPPGRVPNAMGSNLVSVAYFALADVDAGRDDVRDHYTSIGAETADFPASGVSTDVGAVREAVRAFDDFGGRVVPQPGNGRPRRDRPCGRGRVVEAACSVMSTAGRSAAASPGAHRRTGATGCSRTRCGGARRSRPDRSRSPRSPGPGPGGGPR